jgi:hypothetical protein
VKIGKEELEVLKNLEKDFEKMKMEEENEKLKIEEVEEKEEEKIVEELDPSEKLNNIKKKRKESLINLMEKKEESTIDLKIGENLDDDYFSKDMKKKKIQEIKEISNQDQFLIAKGKYVDLLNQKLSSPKSILNFNSSLELDLERLKLNITPQQRDTILVNSGYNVDSFDPNNFVYVRDEKVESFLRNKNKKNKCFKCGLSMFNKYSCRYCTQCFCNKCIHKDKFPIVEYMITIPDYVCYACGDKITNQQTMLKEIRKYVQIEENNQKSTSIESKLFSQLYPCQSIPTIKLNDETNLAEFPSGGILSNVNTKEGSPPIESILFPYDLLSNEYVNKLIKLVLASTRKYKHGSNHYSVKLQCRGEQNSNFGG